jgi:hypothetical protein
MAPTETTQTYPVATKLDVGVNRLEDRVVLIAETVSQERRAALLTRRMMQRLLEKIAAVLERTSETASQAASGHRDEVLQMEHVSALASLDREGDESDPPARRAAEEPSAVFLITDAHFKARGGRIVVALDGVERCRDGADGTARGEVFVLVADRTTAHKVLAMLKDKADEAEWDLPRPSGWTDKLQQAAASKVN